MPAFSEGDPLHRAVELRDVEQVKELLAAGGEVDVCARGGVTALMAAAARGFNELVNLLLEAGANPNAKEERSKLGEGRLTALHAAAEYGHATACKILLDHGADPNSTSQSSLTPLNYACHVKSLE